MDDSSTAFQQLEQAIRDHLLSTLRELHFFQLDVRSGWWGGTFVFNQNGVYLQVSFDTAHAQLKILLGNMSGNEVDTPFVEYLRGAEVDRAAFIDACGFWDSEGLLPSNLDKALPIVARTLPAIMANYEQLRGEIVARTSGPMPA